mmetsp:Transcript_11758/g.43658  ORF Transcript_11758/g.43658 Transcript_11758/m.43658 type:complete len:269 (-) Transcript_11758:3512-4318(-)
MFPVDRPRSPPNRFGALYVTPPRWPPATGTEPSETLPTDRPGSSPAPSMVMTFSATRFSRADFATARSCSRLFANSLRSRIKLWFATFASRILDMESCAAPHIRAPKSLRPANKSKSTLLSRPQAPTTRAGRCVGPPAPTPARISESLDAFATLGPRPPFAKRRSNAPLPRAFASSRSYGDETSCTAAPSPRPARNRSGGSSTTISKSSSSDSSPTSGSSTSFGYSENPPFQVFHSSNGSAENPPPPPVKSETGVCSVTNRSRSDCFL